ncbi:sugar transferase [Streptomyces sp. NPDC047821]|uniref:sugar transferase n=1 Tax=Streptomyces sp. NPDC047821 TaxID=3365488 RepID=UPI0037165364
MRPSPPPPSPDQPPGAEPSGTPGPTPEAPGLTPDLTGPLTPGPTPEAPDLTPELAEPPAPRQTPHHAEPPTLERPATPRRPLDPKRALDLTLGSALLVLVAPLLLAATVATALSRPPGGVFVTETRTGLDGRPFTLRHLPTRRFGLHALSRLPHVVRGEMSLVGPEPLPPGHPAARAPWRRTVRPGLTGLAQARRTSALPWDEPLLLDQHYVEHHWIGLDLALLLSALRTSRRSRPARPSRRPSPAPSRTVPGQAHLSDADHRLRGYSAAE